MAAADNNPSVLVATTSPNTACATSIAFTRRPSLLPSSLGTRSHSFSTAFEPPCSAVSFASNIASNAILLADPRSCCCSCCCCWATPTPRSSSLLTAPVPLLLPMMLLPMLPMLLLMWGFRWLKSTKSCTCGSSEKHKAPMEYRVSLRLFPLSIKICKAFAMTSTSTSLKS